MHRFPRRLAIVERSPYRTRSTTDPVMGGRGKLQRRRRGSNLECKLRKKRTNSEENITKL